MKLKLNLGCGNDVKQGWQNYDIKPINKNVKFIDLEKKLPFKKESVSEILLDNVLEHIKNWEGLLKECSRILEKDGMLCVKVPYFRQCGAYRLDHVNFFTLVDARRLKSMPFRYFEYKLVFLSHEKLYALPFDLVGRVAYQLLGERFYEYYVSAISPASEIKMMWFK